MANWLRLPRVVGEIGGGLALGPHVLGSQAPRLHGEIFAPSPVLAFAGWCGLLLLMTQAGRESAAPPDPQDRRAVAWLVCCGTLLPLLVGWGLAQVVHTGPFMGPHAGPGSAALMAALAIAVTALPVLARMLLDLRMAGTRLGRLALAMACVEDFLLWALLALALALSGSQGTSPWQAPSDLLAAALLFLLALGPARWAWAALRQRMPLPAAMQPYLLLLLGVLLAALLGINPVFGAFLAGRVLGEVEEGEEGSPLEAPAALLVPICFALVGFRLKMGLELPWLSLLAFGGLAVVVKGGAVLLGARLGKLPWPLGLRLAVALNARGAMGVVLATVALEAGLLSPVGHAMLVALALGTTVVAGWLLVWLGEDANAAAGSEAPRPARCHG